MKLLLLLALAVPIIVPTRPLKPWTHDMCQVRQKYATDDYLTYCRNVSAGKHPRCREDDATGYAKPHGKDDRFEYWDCSWHPRNATGK
jgi:hypothetical protein